MVPLRQKLFEGRVFQASLQIELTITQANCCFQGRGLTFLGEVRGFKNFFEVVPRIFHGVGNFDREGERQDIPCNV